mgnify:CR=1 FL=1
MFQNTTSPVPHSFYNRNYFQPALKFKTILHNNDKKSTKAFRILNRWKIVGVGPPSQEECSFRLHTESGCIKKLKFENHWFIYVFSVLDSINPKLLPTSEHNFMLPTYSTKQTYRLNHDSLRKPVPHTYLRAEGKRGS